jgi:hypothetical protein
MVNGIRTIGDGFLWNVARLKKMIQRIEGARWEDRHLIRRRIALPSPRQNEGSSRFEDVAFILTVHKHWQEVRPKRMIRNRCKERVANDLLESPSAYSRLLRMRLRLESENQFVGCKQTVQRSYRLAVEIGIDSAVVADDQVSREVGPAYSVPIAFVNRQESRKELRDELAVVVIGPEAILIVRMIAAPAFPETQPALGDLLRLPGLVNNFRYHLSALASVGQSISRATPPVELASGSAKAMDDTTAADAEEPK